jgi:hypothetical protein
MPWASWQRIHEERYAINYHCFLRIRNSDACRSCYRSDLREPQNKSELCYQLGINNLLRLLVGFDH